MGACRPPEYGRGSGGTGSASAGADMAANPSGSAGMSGAAAEGGLGRPGAWLVFRGVRWQSLDRLTLAAALGCCLPQLLRLLREEEQADELAKVQQAVQRLLPVEQPFAAQAAALAAHWQLREQLRQRQAAAQGDAAAAAAMEVRELLLLHLFASAFLVDQLCRSRRQEDAVQLQHLLAASGFPCRLAAHKESGRSRKKRRKERKKEKKRKRKRRRRSNDVGSDSDNSSSSDSEGATRRHRGAEGEAWLGSRAQPSTWADSIVAAQPLWQLGVAPQGSGGPAVSSLELLDAVMDATATAHAGWLLG